jgi:hypothetical protein
MREDCPELDEARGSCPVPFGRGVIFHSILEKETGYRFGWRAVRN